MTPSPESRAAARRQYAARPKPTKECRTCWTVGGHDPRCRAVEDAKKAAAARRVK